jgi:IS1 family transposase
MMSGMNRLSREDRVRVVSALVEGNSIRATVRMTGVAKNTVTKLLVELGNACEFFHNENVRNVPSERVQADDIWSYVGMKEKNVPRDRKGILGFGDVWTWTALDADSKLVITWLVGDRSGNTAEFFLRDLASRLAKRVQLTTDQHQAYAAGMSAFGGDVDYAQIRKIYGQEHGDTRRYSPPVCLGCTRKTLIGNPKKKHISTSYVERQNLTIRMGMRRFTRLTNGFSKKLSNLCAAVAIHFTFYNFCRPHLTLEGRTPAMASGLADHKWSIEELIGLLSKFEV